METGIDKPEVVLSDYVIDYTRLNIDQRVLMKSETDGYDFRYTYGLDLVNVKATGEGTDWWAQSVKKCVYSDYIHTDRLGSVVNLTDQYGRVPAQIDYDDWGKVTAYQSLNISGGYRRVLPEITYAGHQYDDVLNMFYAKARMYDAENRRFASVDPVKGNITNPMTMVQYLYVVDDPLGWVDPMGLISSYLPNFDSTVSNPVSGASNTENTQIKNGYVPLREFAESFGGYVSWDQETSRGSVFMYGTTMYYTASSADNDHAYQYNGTMYVDKKEFLKQWGLVEEGNLLLASDYAEFGNKPGDPWTYNILKNIQYRWKNRVDDKPYEYYQRLACEVRTYARRGTPFKYGQEEIWDILHANTDYMQSLVAQTGKIYAYALFLDLTCGEWDYKYKKEWRVPYRDFVDRSPDQKTGVKYINRYMDEEYLLNPDGPMYLPDGSVCEELWVSVNRRNWTPWIYFEGEIIGADQLGNLNLAYVATKVNFTKWAYDNRVTRDNEHDAYALDLGIRLANSGR